MFLVDEDDGSSVGLGSVTIGSGAFPVVVVEVVDEVVVVVVVVVSF